MKRLLIGVLTVLLCACSEENVGDNTTDSTVVGTWQLVEQNVGIGPPGEWEDMDNGPFIRFNEDGSFVKSHFDCVPLSFTVENNLIKLAYDCPEGTKYDEWPSYLDSINYRITALSGQYMTLTPATLICTEGCAYRYVRVEEEYD